ncbi:MAG: ribonuclease R [Micavibrio sp.]|nr:ribonuclease R [Micavibrio sp.]
MSSIDQYTILELIRGSGEALTKREIARALGIKGGENRVALKQILKTLEKEEAIIKQDGGAYSVPDGLPSAGVVEITTITPDGDMMARPIEWNTDTRGKPPKIMIVPDKKYFARMSEGGRALVRLKRVGENDYEAHIIKTLDTERNRILGLIHFQKKGAILTPTDKKARYDFDILTGDLNGAKEGDLALGEVQPERGSMRKRVRIVEVIGRRDDPKAISLISLHEAGLSEEWPKDTLKASEGLEVPSLKGREDLRDVPLVTIDGADARDFDDAVFAEKQDDGGYHLIVAIADVAYYVRFGSALDTEARRRGNSTYFPDRVVPMLPENLSNDLCSLRPNEPRATLAAHMWIDKDGNLKSYKFTRALIKSHARLVYEQVQAAKDGQTDDLTRPLLKPVIEPLYEAYAILDAARAKRGSLDLDLPERQIIIDENNDMVGVKQRTRVDAHKLIEEFMILANVAAAKAIEAKRDPKQFPCVYRIHDKPKSDKLDSVREFVESFGISLPKGMVMEPKQLNGILRQAAKLPYSHLISTVILRSQSQAVYAADNIGHFGLALDRYAHFTSPIRRYADLLVHRSLISAYDLGPGGITEEETVRIDEIAQHISGTERASMVAERSAVDRFTASYLSDHIGASFEGKISGVTRFGLFVSLNESGADGLIPMKSLGDDFYEHDEKSHALIGKRKGKVFRLGAAITVRLSEADGLTGSCILELAEQSKGGADIPGMVFKTSIPPMGRKPHSKGRGKKGRDGGGKPYKVKSSYAKKNKGGGGKSGGGNKPRHK